MPLTAGRRLGPYEILSPLGAGGMGEVYRAHDGKLNREVAIKVLPDAVARDPERLARFRREAQVLASLNQPHIAAIYGLEESGGLEALVLELVEGETLAERIARGRIPLDESLEIARQIARALEAAHERGIVHRDLKPANVKLTPEGQVKVLDFGLAKALSGSGSSPDVTSSPTMTAAATQAGVVIGTAAYMSPEQARGKAVDKRADIWAFGTVVYEMLAGRKTFEGETVSDMLAAVLTKDPDWSALPPGTPPSVRRVLRRCLDRDAKTRFHDIADARLELDEAPERGPVPASTVAATARRSPLLLSGVIYAAVAADGTFAFVPGTDSAVERSIVLVDRNGKAKALAAPLRSYHYPRFSPDGKRLAVSIGPGHGNADDVWVYDIESGALTRLTFGDENGNYYAVWSHDGRRVAYSSDRAHQGIHLKNADGSGEEEPLQPNPRPDLPSDWSRDGTMLAITRDFPTTHIFTVSLPERKEVPFAANAACPVFSPDGRWIAYTAQLTAGSRPQILVQPVSGSGGKIQLTSEQGAFPVWTDRGLFFLADRKVMVAEVQTQPGFRAGPLRELFEIPYDRGSLPLRNFDVSRDGQTFVFLTGVSGRFWKQIDVVLDWSRELARLAPVGK